MTILITGANRGIGRAMFDIYKAADRPVIGTTRGAPEGPDWRQLDVTDPASHRALCAALDGAPVELLICNAGVLFDRHENLADGYPAQMWADTFAANVTGVFLTVQNALTNLQTARRPRIAIISSQMGSDARAPGGTYIYRASKAAALNLGRNLATDLKHLGIAVGVYHPGWVRTDMGGAGADISPEEAAQGLVERFDALSLETTGCFESYDGQSLAY